MNRDLISVIIPVYNVEKYLSRCIDSVIKQTYANIEIIIVNDGSTDNSGSICDEYEKKDSRIKVIHQKNGGLSDARNAGLDTMSGKWVTFVDSDDYITDKFVEVLYALCVDNKSEISSCSLVTTEESNYEFAKQDNFTKIFSSADALKNIYGEGEVFLKIMACGKLYSSVIFSGLRFKKGIIHEDEELVWKLLFAANKIVATKATMYAYFMSPNSIMRGKFNEKSLVMIAILHERADYFTQNANKELYDLTLKTKAYVLQDFYYKYQRFLPNEKDKVLSIRKDFIETYNKIKNSKFISSKSKISLAIMRFIPTLYSKIKGL